MVGRESGLAPEERTLVEVSLESGGGERSNACRGGDTVLLLEGVAGRDTAFDVIVLAVDVDAGAHEWMEGRVVTELVRLRQRYSAG